MAHEQVIPEADQTAVRVALWRALHLELDGQPPVLADPVGLRLADPADGWRGRPDMDPVERRPEYAGRLRVSEIDQPAAQAWKRQRLTELGYGVPEWLRLVPVDFEAGASWWDLLVAAGFSPADAAPAGRARAGVDGRDDVPAPAELLDEQDRPGLAMAANGARSSGTPFISYFSAEEIVALAREAGFADARRVPAAELNDRYFAGRSDGLRMSTGEDLLVATV